MSLALKGATAGWQTFAHHLPTPHDPPHLAPTYAQAGSESVPEDEQEAREMNLQQIKEAAEKASENLGEGAWAYHGAGHVWAPSLKGGQTRIIDVRGWGYLTGGGHGALGLDGDTAVAQQDKWGRFIALADPSTVLRLVQIAEAAGELEAALASPDNHLSFVMHHEARRAADARINKARHALRALLTPEQQP